MLCQRHLMIYMPKYFRTSLSCPHKMSYFNLVICFLSAGIHPCFLTSVTGNLIVVSCFLCLRAGDWNIPEQGHQLCHLCLRSLTVQFPDKRSRPGWTFGTGEPVVRWLAQSLQRHPVPYIQKQGRQDRSRERLLLPFDFVSCGECFEFYSLSDHMETEMSLANLYSCNAVVGLCKLRLC